MSEAFIVQSPANRTKRIFSQEAEKVTSAGTSNPENTAEATEPKVAKLAAPQETADKAEPSDAPLRYEVTFQYIHKPNMSADVSSRLHWCLVPIACVHCFSSFFYHYVEVRCSLILNFPPGSGAVGLRRAVQR